MVHAALAAPVAVFTGALLWSGGPRAELLRLIAALGALTVSHPELSLALAGLALLRRGGPVTFDGATMGWGLLAAAHASAMWTSAQSPLRGALIGTAAFMIAGLWPFVGSWQALDEGWGRRVARGMLGVHAFSVVLPSANSIVVDAWAPWAVLLPGAGVLWAAALTLCGGQRPRLALLWFFELQMIALVCLGVRNPGPRIVGVMAWAAILPISLLMIAVAARKHSGRTPGRFVGALAMASIMGIPGAVGFAARFLAVSRLLSGSPAGLICYGVGLVVVPIVLRPLREELRDSAVSRSSMAACGIIGAAIVVLGVAPGLTGGDHRTFWIWQFLLMR